MKANDTFLMLIPKLEVTEFIGLAKILKVRLIDEVKDSEERYVARSFADVFEDMVRAFDSAPRTRKREILQLVKAATKKGGKL